MIRILFLGDIIGEPGRSTVIERLPELKVERGIDFVIVNGENAAGGRGLTPKIAIDLLRAGAAVITTGDHVWDQRELADYLRDEPRVLRPVNFPEGAPGEGFVVLETPKGRVAVINAMGRTFMNPPLDNPFPAVDGVVDGLREAGVRVIFLDFHAEATSEKVAMGRAMDSRISCMVGTHTHVATADDTIFAGGTAYLTDAGMCGPENSVIGSEVASVVWRFRTGMPTRFPVAKGAVRLSGAVVDIDEKTGKAMKMERFSELHGASVVGGEIRPVA